MLTIYNKIVDTLMCSPDTTGNDFSRDELDAMQDLLDDWYDSRPTTKDIHTPKDGDETIHPPTSYIK